MTLGDARLAVVLGVLWLAETAGFQVGIAWAAAIAALAFVVVVGLGCCLRLAPIKVHIRLALALVLAPGLAGAVLAGTCAAPLTADPIPELTSSGLAVPVLIELTEVPRETSPAVGWNLNAEGTAARDLSVRATLLYADWEGNRWYPNVPILAQISASHAAHARAGIRGTQLSLTAVLTGPGDSPVIAARMSSRSEAVVTRTANGLDQWADTVRQQLRDHAQNLAPDPGGLLAGLVVGDESRLDPGLREAMERSGLSHLTAVSGSNIAIVAGAVLFLARLLRLPKRIAVVIALVVLGGYLVVVGPEPSVLRATAMGTLALVAVATSTESRAIAILLVSSLALLVVDPWLAISLGFALSVTATGALILFAGARSAPLWRRLLVAASAAGIATIPLIASFGEGIPTYTIAANLAAEMAVAPATLLGFGVLATYWWAPTLAGALIQLAGYPAGWIASVARYFGERPLATIPVPGGLAGALLSGSVLLLAAVAWREIRRRGWSLRTGRLRLLAGVLLAVTVAAHVRAEVAWPAPGWLMVFCDVGQGDGMVINAGAGSAMVVDAGPDPARMDRCLRELGITQVSLLVLTHFHVDHVGGLAGVLANRNVARVVVSPVPEPPDQERWVRRELDAKGIPTGEARIGEWATIGPIEYQIIWPTQRTDPRESVPNNASVTVIAAISGVTAFLGGDLEPSAQREVARRLPTPFDVDVVKVPHHGSRNQAPELHTALQGARVAVVSVGRNNRYHHPSPETLEQWAAGGAQLYRTDQEGDVAVLRGSEPTTLEVRTSNSVAP